jgi:cold shock CspA family protein
MSMTQSATITRWISDRGFGFARLDGSSDEEAFLHLDDLKFDPPKVMEGLRVRCLVRETSRGLRAADVQRLDRTDAPPTA